jgi:hypothetical protein
MMRQQVRCAAILTVTATTLTLFLFPLAVSATTDADLRYYYLLHSANNVCTGDAVVPKCLTPMCLS